MHGLQNNTDSFKGEKKDVTIILLKTKGFSTLGAEKFLPENLFPVVGKIVPYIR